ncbi:MAG: carbohydrate binding family 9 domain-containing protein, partial [bacterium]
MSLIVVTCKAWSIESDKKDDRSNDVLVDKNAKRYITALRANQRPDIDGHLNDPAWEAVSFQAHFLQREPVEGAAATEKTEVGVLYDEQNLYFGIKCYDSEPDRIIAREMRRDARLTDDDYFALIIDTYHDHRSGYYFTTNPNGAKRDGVIANEGRDYNSAWDGVWWCKARIAENGWFAEIAIPWKTLRFAREDSSTWGINFARTIRRKNEQVFWQLVPRDFGYFGLFRLSEAGTLQGMRNLRTGGNLEIRPYFLGGLENDLNTDLAT